MLLNSCAKAVNFCELIYLCIRRPGELENLTREVIGQVRRLAITGKTRQDKVFLGVDVSRLGYVNKENLREICVNHHLPSDPDIIDLVSINNFSKFVLIIICLAIQISLTWFVNFKITIAQHSGVSKY